MSLAIGDCRITLARWAAEGVRVQCVNRGRFQKGQHWRKPRPWWDKAWLVAEYVTAKRSAAEIAQAGGCTENNILFWLKKHGIPARSMREIRRGKRWGSYGASNPMFGKVGALSPNWRGGLTPARQAMYASREWQSFARAVRRRDRACRLCGAAEHLEIHHIDPFYRVPLLAMDMANVIRLCQRCHRKLRGKEMWWRKRLWRLLGEEVMPVR